MSVALVGSRVTGLVVIAGKHVDPVPMPDVKPLNHTGREVTSMLMTMNLGVAPRQFGAVNWETRTFGVDRAPLCRDIVDAGLGERVSHGAPGVARLS